jgi:phospholipase C
VISPYARTNSVDHSITDQSSILRFVEDNWLNGARFDSSSFDNKAGTLDNLFRFSGGEHSGKLFLDPCTGAPGNSGEGTGDSSKHAASGQDPNAVNCPSP